MGGEARPPNLYEHLVRGLGGDGGGAPDAQLLELFARGGDEDAFAALVRRHGPMVLGVCRRLLGNSHDAEDAFQATFLVLARRARAVRRGEALAGWLHTTATRVACRARQSAEARRRREREAALMAEPVHADDVAWDEVRRALDEELAALPAAERAAVVLCHLEGRTHAEAARELGCPVGSVWWRLGQALKRLRAGLGRRGLVVSAVLLAEALPTLAAPCPVPAELTRSAVSGAGSAGLVSARAAALADAAVRSLALARLRGLLGALLLAALGTAGFLLTRDAAPPPPAPVPPPLAPLPAGLRVREPVALAGHPQGAAWTAVSPDGKRAVTAGLDGTARFWDLDAGKEGEAFRVGPPGLRFGHVHFSPDGKSILVSGPQVPPVQLAAGAPRFERIFEGTTGGVTALAVSPDGRYVAAGHERTVYVWELASGKRLIRFDAHEGLVGGLAFSPDGRTLASSGPGGQVLLTETATGKRVMALPGHAPWAVAFDPRGYAVLSTASDREVILTELASGKPRRRWTVPGDSAVSIVAYAPDGRFVAAGCQDGAIHVWDLRTGEGRQLEKHRSVIESLTFAPGGRRLLSVARGEGAVLVWEIVPKK